MFGKVYIALFSVAVVSWAHADAQMFTSCTQANEAWTICGTLCEQTCANPTGSGFLCPEPICLRFVTGGCRCNPGYVRNTANNACVLLPDCP